jgi:hypothetical protein
MRRNSQDPRGTCSEMGTCAREVPLVLAAILPTLRAALTG